MAKRFRLSRELDSGYDVDEVKDIRDKAMVFEAYSRHDKAL